MKIGICINEVLRNFVGKLQKTYEKMYPEQQVILPISTFDLSNHFPFEGGSQEFSEFLYDDVALEVFGHADELHPNIINHLNTFFLDLKQEGEHEIILLSREAGPAIPSTLFFLSKTSCKVNQIVFVQDSAAKWDHVDVLITANPIALEKKPEGKISVKISASYNENVAADYVFDSLKDIISNRETLEKILNTRTITYENL
jgi:hypothetical protein